MKKKLKIFCCFVCSVCLLYGCASGTKEVEKKINSNNDASHIENNNNNVVENKKDVLSLIENSTLLYPSANSQYEYNVYEDFVEITKYLGSEQQISIPNEIDNLPVYVVGGINPDYTSEDRGKTTNENEITKKVIIPDSVVVIKEGAFHCFAELKSIEFGDSVQIIEPYAFEGCSELERVEFPDSLKTIDEYAFAWSGNHVDNFEVILNNGLQEIGLRAFYDGDIDEITIPKSVVSIGNKAFTGKEKETKGLGDERILTVKGYKGSVAAQYVVESNEYVDDANPYDKFLFSFQPLD